LTTTFDLTSHPILDAVRNSLLPTTPPGYYLTTERDKLEVLLAGAHLSPQPAYLRNDGRLATIIITLPSNYRGGALVIRDKDGKEDRFAGKGGKGEVEWTAFLGDCDYLVEPVAKGCRLTLSYAVLPKAFGVDEGINHALALPSDPFFDLIAPILNQERGRRIAFFLAHDYKSNPADSLADTLIPQVRTRLSHTHTLVSHYSAAEGWRRPPLPSLQVVQTPTRASLDRGRLHVALRSVRGVGGRYPR
jgi:hypothetical protein